MFELADVADIGLILLDESGKVSFANQWVRRHSGATCDSAGVSLEDFLPGDVDTHLVRCVSGTLVKGMAYRLSHALHPAPLPLFDPGGGAERIRQAVDLRLLISPAGKRFCLIQVRDVSEAVKRERLLREQARQLNLEVHKLESSRQELHQRTLEAEAANSAKSMFLSVVSHELRSPLHTILGYASLLKREGEDRTSTEFVETIERSGLHLMRIIDDILEFSRGEAEMRTMQPRLLALRDLASRLEAYGRMAELDADEVFDVRLSPHLPAHVKVDEQRLMQILTNLVDNAFKFSGNKSVWVEIFPDNPRPDDCFADGEIVDIAFSISDKGRGIAEQYLGRIFDPFFRQPEVRYHPGLGLGLSITRQIVLSMGGTIEASNRPEGGCRMTVVLPLVCKAPMQTDVQAVERHPTGYAGKRKNLLVVDDIGDHRRLLEQFLSKLGFSVLQASSARLALEILKHEKVGIDLVLSDLYMDDGDGWSLLEEVRSNEALKHCPVVAVSASDSALGGASTRAEFDGVLRKPVDRSVLLSLVGNLLDVEWIYDDFAMSGRQAGSGGSSSLAGCLGDEFRELLADGRITAMIELANIAATDRPELADVCNEIVHLCNRADLPGLEAFLAMRLSSAT